MKTNQDANRLGSESIGKLLLSFAIPSVLATTASSIYNIIDRIIIGKELGSIALSSLALTFPIMNLQIAVGTLMGIGSSTLISIYLGKNKQQQATQALGNAFIFNLILAVILGAFVWVFCDSVLMAFGASEHTIGYARDFIKPLMAFNFITGTFYGMNNIVRSSGYPQTAMYSIFITVLCNIILAPLFVMVFKWGVAGAAYATLISQTTGTIWVMSHLMNPKHSIHFTRACFKWSWDLIGRIVAIGLSPFSIFLATSLVILVTNLTLKEYGGDLSIGAYGIINTYSTFFVVIIVGINQAMQPIAGYNYGAQKNDRVIAVFKMCAIVATIITSSAFLLGILAPHWVAQWFTDDQQLIDIASRGLSIYVLFFPIIGFQIVGTNLLQSIGKASLSIFCSLTRQVLLLIPALLILPHFWGLNGVWASSPLADVISVAITSYILWVQMGKLKSHRL